MLKKINKQREKIEKLIHKESDAADKLELCRQELAEEKATLDEMEKEYLFSLVRGKKLSLEETIAILESRTPLTMESTEAVTDILKEDEKENFDSEGNQKMQEVAEEDDLNLATEETAESNCCFGRFGKDDSWKQ